MSQREIDEAMVGLFEKIVIWQKDTTEVLQTLSDRVGSMNDRMDTLDRRMGAVEKSVNDFESRLRGTERLINLLLEDAGKNPSGP